MPDAGCTIPVKEKKMKIEPKIRQFRLSQLRAASYHPRTISKDALEGLTNSIKKFGCVEPIAVNVRNNKNTIIGGHQRYRVLAGLHAADYQCFCVTVDLSGADEKLLNITLNNPKIQGRFIEDLGRYIDRLRKQLNVKADYFDLKIDRLRAELGETEKQGLTYDDEIPKPPKKPVTKKGDLWILGKHRLLCGDSTNSEHVQRLMGKEKAALFATDPPYFVNYTEIKRPVKTEGKNWSGLYHEIDIDKAAKFLRDFLQIGFAVVRDKTALYIWHAGKRKRMIENVCDELDILIHQQIIWVKPCSVLTFSFYPWRHEPCLLMWQKGKKPHFKHKESQIGTVWPVGWVKEGDPTTPEYYTDVWELDWEGKKRNPGIEHPTVKPVEIFAIPMRVHTTPGDICYEPFCGSGSQIIAAEKLARRCFAMELEPVFCDVAVKRWEQWTGRKAELIRGTKGARAKSRV